MGSNLRVLEFNQQPIVLDTAKAVALLATNQDMPHDDVILINGELLDYRKHDAAKLWLLKLIAMLRKLRLQIAIYKYNELSLDKRVLDYLDEPKMTSPVKIKFTKRVGQ